MGDVSAPRRTRRGWRRPLFNGLFSDTSSEFKAFNALALSKIVDAAPGEKGVSRSAANRTIESFSEELLSGSKGFEYRRSYAMLLRALKKHLAADCAAMDTES